MNFAEKYANFIETQQSKFPDWVVQDHGAGGHVEMMKDVISKDGKKVMVFIWNDESATVFPHPTDKSRYVTMEDWNDVEIFQTLWDNQDEWVSIMYRESEEMEVYPIAKEMFDENTIQEFLNIFKELNALHKQWDEE